MNDYTREQIDRLQDNLLTIRQAGGWSAAEFGDMIGVTKQTVRNLENHVTDMTKTQYIATRAVLDYEVARNPDNQVLGDLVEYLLDSEKLSDEEKEKAKSAVAYVSGARSAGMDKASIIKGVAALIGVAAGGLLLGSAMKKTSWYDKIIHPTKWR